MLRFRRDKTDFPVGFGCCTVSGFLFRSGRQHQDSKLRPLSDSARLCLKFSCAPQFREHDLACPMDERRLLHDSDLSRFILD